MIPHTPRRAAPGAARAILASLPAVHEVLGDPGFREASATLADVYRTRLVRQVIDRHRAALIAEHTTGVTPEQVRTAVVTACTREAAVVARPFPRRVVNGTGVLIHTNLGRAPLGDLIQQLDTRTLAGYTDLEWDASTQARGDRDLGLQRQLQLLTGAEGALVVNNCASALLLALDTLADGKEVLVSRSELVEIGGSFRVPEIMEASGCHLREVGTTNRTRIADYERHAGPNTAALLKVHQSNFVQRGYVAQVAVDELVTLGRRLGVPVVEDNGSGLIDDVAQLDDEPNISASLERGADVVCCSADKLWGGVQAGFLLGRSDLISAMRQNPLYRALRLDKVRIALLDQCLKRYLAGRAAEMPLWRLFNTSIEDLWTRGAQLRLPGPESRWASCQLVALRATLGGGSSPEVDHPSVGLALVHRDLSPDALRRCMAARVIPLVGYVGHDRFHLDLCTVFPDDLPEIQQALDELAGLRS